LGRQSAPYPDHILEEQVGIGASIFLIAVGAILAFAVNAEISGLDIAVIGYILMGAGVLGLLLTMLVWGPRKRTSVEQHRVYDDSTPDGTIVEERRRYDSGGASPPPV
jgi:Domain of unknown function (DUF6458)